VEQDAYRVAVDRCIKETKQGGVRVDSGVFWVGFNEDGCAFSSECGETAADPALAQSDRKRSGASCGATPANRK
jgi:hypothetical protein